MRLYSNTVMPVSAKRSVLAPPDSFVLKIRFGLRWRTAAFALCLLGIWESIRQHSGSSQDRRANRPCWTSRAVLMSCVSTCRILMAECLLQLRTDRMSGSIWSRSAAISMPLKLAERFYTQTEYEMIKSRPVADHAFQFYRLWVAKEALLKAQGTGIAVASAMRDSCARLFVTSERPAVRRFGDATGLDGSVVEMRARLARSGVCVRQ